MAKIKQIKVGATTYDIEPKNSEVLASSHITDALGYTPLGTTDIINNVTSTASDKVLAAAQGKVLSDRISSIEGRGRYLTTWNASTGKPSDLPGGGSSVTEVYTYKTGDYFIVHTAGNKFPTGTSIAVGTTIANFPSETRTSEPAGVNDTIYFNGTSWTLLHTPVTQTVWGGIGGTLSNQTDLQSALDAKVNKAGDTMTGNLYFGSSNYIANANDGLKLAGDNNVFIGSGNDTNDNTYINVQQDSLTFKVNDWSNESYQVLSASDGGTSSAPHTIATREWCNTNKVNKAGDTLSGDLYITAHTTSLVAGQTYHLHIPAGTNMQTICGDDCIYADNFTNIVTTISQSTRSGGMPGIGFPPGSETWYGVAITGSTGYLMTPAAADFDCDFYCTMTGTYTWALPYITNSHKVLTTADGVLKSGDTMTGDLSLGQNDLKLGTSTDARIYAGTSTTLTIYNSRSNAIDIQAWSINLNAGGGIKTCGIYPATNNYFDLGTILSKWKDLYLSGDAKLNTATVSGNFTFASDKGLLNSTSFASANCPNYIPVTNKLLDWGVSAYDFPKDYLAKGASIFNTYGDALLDTSGSACRVYTTNGYIKLNPAKLRQLSTFTSNSYFLDNNDIQLKVYIENSLVVVRNNASNGLIYYYDSSTNNEYDNTGAYAIYTEFYDANDLIRNSGINIFDIVNGNQTIYGTDIDGYINLPQKADTVELKVTDVSTKTSNYDYSENVYYGQEYGKRYIWKGIELLNAYFALGGEYTLRRHFDTGDYEDYRFVYYENDIYGFFKGSDYEHPYYQIYDDGSTQTVLVDRLSELAFVLADYPTQAPTDGSTWEDIDFITQRGAYTLQLYVYAETVAENKVDTNGKVSIDVTSLIPQAGTKLYKHTLNGDITTYGDPINFYNLTVISTEQTAASTVSTLNSLLNDCLFIKSGEVRDTDTSESNYPWAFRNANFVGLDGSWKVSTLYVDGIASVSANFTDTVEAI